MPNSQRIYRFTNRRGTKPCRLCLISVLIRNTLKNLYYIISKSYRQYSSNRVTSQGRERDYFFDAFLVSSVDMTYW